MHPRTLKNRTARPRRQRGFSLLLALGLIALITASVVVSLRAVTTESNLQSHERRSREAFFAAQAAMSEARALVQSSVGATGNYSGVLAELGDYYAANTGPNRYVEEDGLPSTAGFEWYEVIPWKDYTLARGTVGAAINPNVTGANLEMNGPDGQPITDFPEPANVRYRAFLVDDEDLDVNAGDGRKADFNGRVWLVAVGEVSTPGGQPIRTIIRSLITSTSAPTNGVDTYGQKGEGAGHTGSSSSNPRTTGGAIAVHKG